MKKFLLDSRDPAFSREFASLKTMRQFAQRNPGLKATPYMFFEFSWQRFAILGNQVIPVSLLRSLLNSLETLDSLTSPLSRREGREVINEAPAASSTNHLSHNPLN